MNKKGNQSDDESVSFSRSDGKEGVIGVRRNKMIIFIRDVPAGMSLGRNDIAMGDSSCCSIGLVIGGNT